MSSQSSFLLLQLQMRAEGICLNLPRLSDPPPSSSHFITPDVTARQKGQRTRQGADPSLLTQNVATDGICRIQSASHTGISRSSLSSNISPSYSRVVWFRLRDAMACISGSECSDRTGTRMCESGTRTPTAFVVGRKSLN